MGRIMKTMKAAKRTLAMLCAIVAATLALTGTAFAATVHGADYVAGGSEFVKQDATADKDVNKIDVLNVGGKQGDTIFLTVLRDGRVAAKNLAFTIEPSQSGSQEDWGGSWGSIATIDISNFDLANDLNGKYTVKAFADRAGSQELYSGKIYGVYADLPNNKSMLIGMRTVNDAEATGRTFTAPTNIYSNGKSYRLKGDATGKDQLHFAYEEYDPAKTVDGVISFRDADGNVVATKTYKVTSGEPLELSYNATSASARIPSVVADKNGNRYRTVFLGGKIVMEYPGKTSYSMYCVKMSAQDESLAGYYKQDIEMVDEAGNVIARDSVYVTGNFVYTLPERIYKKTRVESMQADAVVIYQLKDQKNTIEFKADSMNATKPAVQAKYASLEPTADTEVTFNLIDGSKRVLDRKSGLIEPPKKVMATPDTPTVVPDATVTVDGKAYKIGRAHV